METARQCLFNLREKRWCLQCTALEILFVVQNGTKPRLDHDVDLRELASDQYCQGFR